MYNDVSAFLNHDNSWQGGLILAIVAGILFAGGMLRVGENDDEE